MKTNEEIAEIAEREKWLSFDKGGHAEISNPHFDIIYEEAFIKGYQAAQEEITTEVKRRVALIISEPNGIVREFMIANLINL